MTQAASPLGACQIQQTSIVTYHGYHQSYSMMPAHIIRDHPIYTPISETLFEPHTRTRQISNPEMTLE